MAHNPPPRAGRPVDGRRKTKTTQPQVQPPDIADRQAGRLDRPPKRTKQQIKNIQAFLKARGYQVGQDGLWGPLTQSAFDDFHRGSNKRNPRAWNRQFGPAAPGNNLPSDAPGKPKPKGKGKGADRTTASADEGTGRPDVPYYNPSSYSMGQRIPDSIVNVGTPLDPRAADAMAGAEFDPQLRDLGIQKARQPIQAAQNQRDIRSWYDQVLASQGKAAQRDAEINAAAQESLGQSGRELVSSLGGDANLGASNIAGEAQNVQGTLGAIGVAQEQYNQDVQPIMRQESAGVRAREMARQTQLGQDIANQIINARGQRGQRKVGYEQDIRNQNNTLAQTKTQLLLGVRDRNNQITQAGSQFRFGVQQANSAAAQQDYNNQLAQYQAQLAAQVADANLQLDYYKASQAGVGKSPWSKVSTSDRGGLAAAASDAGESARKDGKVSSIVRAVFNTYRTAGIRPGDSPEADTAMAAVLTDLGVQVDPRWFPKRRKK